MVEFAKPLEHLPTSAKSTLGAEGIKHAYEAENLSADMAVAHHNKQLVEEMLQAGTPNPTEGKIKRLLARIKRTPYASKEDQARISTWLKETDNQYLSWASERLESHITLLGFDLDEVKVRKEVKLQEVRKELSNYHNPHKKELDELWNSDELGVPQIFRNAKAKDEKESGRQLGWIEWITQHANDTTLVNVLEWSAHKVEEESNTPEFQAKCKRIKEDYARGLQAAYRDDILDDVGLSTALARLERTEINTFHPLSQVRGDLNVNGTAHIGKDYVEIRPDVRDYAAHHELSHHLFGATSRIFDEATIEKATKYIYKQGSGDEPSPSQVYEKEDIPGLDSLLNIANMSDEEWLAICLDSKFEGIEKLFDLDQMIAERTGYNFLYYAEVEFKKLIDSAIKEFGASAQWAARKRICENMATLEEWYNLCGKPESPQEAVGTLLGKCREGVFSVEEGTQIFDFIANYNKGTVDARLGG